jgi:hypothetical protein
MSRIAYNNYMLFSYDPQVRENVIQKLISDQLERKFKVGGELVYVDLINGIPTDRDIYMKTCHIWSTYDKAARLAYCQ